MMCSPVDFQFSDYSILVIVDAFLILGSYAKYDLNLVLEILLDLLESPTGHAKKYVRVIS